MKKPGLALWIASALFLLTACGSPASSYVYTVVREDRTVTVGLKNGTIADEADVSHCTVSGGASATVTITYPNGSA